MSRAFYLLENDEPAFDTAGRALIPRDNKLGHLEEAGWFCQRDNLTLCREGPEFVHAAEATWFDECPACNAEPPNLTWAHSFTWALPTGTVLDGHQSDGLAAKVVQAIHRAEQAPEIRPIVDDNGHLFTVAQFFEIANGAPIRFNSPVFIHQSLPHSHA